MILYRRRPSTNVPFSLRLKQTRSPCGHPGPPETEVGEAQRTSSAALDWGPRYPNLALQTRHSMWSIIFFALVIINTWMLAVRSAVAPWRHNSLSQKKKRRRNKKSNASPPLGGVSKVFLHPPTPNPELTPCGHETKKQHTARRRRIATEEHTRGIWGRSSAEDQEAKKFRACVSFFKHQKSKNPKSYVVCT